MREFELIMAGERADEIITTSLSLGRSQVEALREACTQYLRRSAVSR